MSAPGSRQGLWLALAALGWLAGVAGVMLQPTLWPLATQRALVVAGVALLVAQRWAGRWALVAGLVLLAAGSTGWRAQARLADRLPAALEGVDLWVTGTVARLPQGAAWGTSFLLEPDAAADLAGRAVPLPARLSLAWTRGWDGDTLLAGPPPDLRAGQRWALPLRLRQPHGAANPGGFDLELWLFEQGVGAQGSVRAGIRAPAPRLLGETGHHPVERARQALRDAITLRVAEPRTAGVLAALVVGDQAAIERPDWELFRSTGVAHLMSISGLHVTMFAWLAAAAVGWAWRQSPRAMAWVPAPTAARWGGVALAAAYALLAGWGVPAQRTLWMLATLAALASAGLRWPLPLALLASAVVVAVADPWAITQPGFWLSFCAVALLVAAGSGRPAAAAATWAQRLVAALREHGRSQVVATLGLAPLAMLFFQQVSVVGFLANLVAIPLVTLLVTPLALAGALVPPLWAVAGQGVQALAWLLGALAEWPGATWLAAAAPAWALAPAALGALVLVLPWGWPVRALGLPLLLPLLWPVAPRPAPGQYELVAVDVGQGSAVLVRTQRHLLLYDSGPMYGPDSDAGQRVLLPLLRWRGEARVHTLVLSHRDTDHVGGAASLLAALPVDELLHSLPAGHALLQGRAAPRRCAAGQHWQWDGVAFEVLHPAAGEAAPDERPNARSCVLKVTDAAGRSALLAGDIEAAQEAALLQRHGHALAAPLLLVPHHGSRTSSTPGFVAAVAPQVALLQAGYRNRFGHPAPDVVQRWAAAGATVVRSDTCGAYTWLAGVGGCQREQRRRHWHWRAAAPPP